MRGVVSAGMTTAIEQLGLRDAFDEVHGASAGAFNAAFLLAGQAAYQRTRRLGGCLRHRSDKISGPAFGTHFRG